MQVPKLRFKEFNDEWNNTYIRNIFEERSQKHYQYLELLSVTIDNGVIKRCEISGKNTSSDDKSNYKLVEINDIVYNSMRMWQGASGVSKYKGIVSPAYTILKPKININSNFFGYMFKLPNMIYHFRVNSQGLTSDTWNLKYTQIKDIPINLPSIEEQTKIANFLSLIDRKIELQTQLVDNLKLYKKGLLKKVFSNNLGWKSAKLGDFLVESKIIETNINLNKRLTVRLNLLGIEARNPNYAVEKEEGSTQYRRKAGQFIYGKQNLHKGAFGIIPNYLNNYQSSSDLPSFDFKNDINPIFFYYFMSRENYYKSLESISTGTGSKRINPINFLNLDIKIPSIEEQNRIANLFSNLDKKIELETKKLQGLKTYKKGLLQKMFI